MTDRRFYVYVLFDANAIPRYVGKGQGGRINTSSKRDKRNPLKNAFLNDTRDALGEIPCVIVRNGLTEDEAFEIEKALIAVLGRQCKKTGLLTNLSEGGDGPTSADSKAIHAAMTPLERWAWRKAISDGHQKNPPEQRSAWGRARMDAMGPEGRKAHGRKVSASMLANIPPETRKELAINASSSVTQVVWINNGTKNRRIARNTPIPAGWKSGRIAIAESTLAALRTVAIGRLWITDGARDRRLKSGEPLPTGWRYGRRPKIARSIAVH